MLGCYKVRFCGNKQGAQQGSLSFWIYWLFGRVLYVFCRFFQVLRFRAWIRGLVFFRFSGRFWHKTVWIVPLRTCAAMAPASYDIAIMIVPTIVNKTARIAIMTSSCRLPMRLQRLPLFRLHADCHLAFWLLECHWNFA